VGLDFSSIQVASAQSRYARNGSCPVKFVHGDAMKLPFENETFDVVYNVESSHTYPDYRKFVDEARRVLRKGGAFLTTDFRLLSDAETDAKIIEDVFKKPVQPKDVTHMVLRSFHENQLILPFIDACEAKYMKVLKAETTSRNHSQGWKPHKRGFGLPSPTSCSMFAGRQAEQWFAAGTMNYRMYVLTK
jgi:ubiquinone/menaquinone biosynthesis C-methylase UbiE